MLPEITQFMNQKLRVFNRRKEYTEYIYSELEDQSKFLQVTLNL